jgi:VanZ family protein
VSRSARWWLAAAVVAGVIWWACTRPIEIPSDLPDDTDKAIHAWSWAALTVPLAFGGLARGWSRWLAIGGAVLLACAYGGLVEWYQGFVPGRFPSWGDVIADAIGAVAGGAGALYGSTRHGDRP